MRVSRFYQRCLPSSSPSPRPPAPQPRAADSSWHCRTSTASARAQWALPDLNRESQISVGTAGLQPWAPDVSEHCRTSTASARCQMECQNIRQIECEIECQNVYQIKCQTECQIECQMGKNARWNLRIYVSQNSRLIMSKHASYIISVGEDHSKKLTCYRVHIQQYRPWTTLVSINEEGGKTQKEISMCIIVCACVHFASCFNMDWVFQSRTPWSFNPWEVWKFIRSFQLMRYPKMEFSTTTVSIHPGKSTHDGCLQRWVTNM